MARRIDLLVDERGRTPALAHELTHVVLADWFAECNPPPWLDEGIATLADSETKRALHQRDCHDALLKGTAYHLAELLTLEELSSPEGFAAFYGQSVSLVTFLTERQKPQQLLRFATHAEEVGYDKALQANYGIDNVGQLQRLWLDNLARRGVWKRDRARYVSHASSTR